MCGITGLVSPNRSPIHRRTVNAIYRGPDDRDYLLIARDEVHLGRDRPDQDHLAEVVLLHRGFPFWAWGGPGGSPWAPRMAYTFLC